MRSLAKFFVAAAIAATTALPSELTGWATKNGIRLSDAISIHDNLQSITATRDIEAGEELIALPSSLAFRNLLAKDDAALVELRSKTQSETIDAKVEIALSFLKARQNADSPWKAWFNALPTALDTPMFYQLQDLKLLEKQDGYVKLVQLRRLLESSWTSLVKAVVDPSTTYHQFLFAYSYASARRTLLQMSSEAQDTQLALLPFINAAQHSNSPNCGLQSRVLQEAEVSKIFDAGVAEFILLAGVPIRAGEQITLNYGFTSNYEGFVHHGVVQDDDRLDSLTLVVEKPSDALGSALEKVGISRLSFDITPTSVPVSLLQYLRVKNGANVDDEAVLESLKKGESVTMENDRLALRELIATIQTVRTQWPGSVEEDKALLQSSSLSGIGRAVVHYRIREKLVLQGVERLAKELWAVWLFKSPQ